AARRDENAGRATRRDEGGGRAARRGDAAGARVVARDARTGRLLWRAPGGVFGVAAGRVYTQDVTRDLATGEQVGTHAPLYGGIGFAEAP
ncbi:hypothetical protein, partial [Solirubrobacter soli]|uniref:hypothetical protein n=1 Tax=Solirubrobacter soli TaxID=363832 RepID=UPI00047FC063